MAGIFSRGASRVLGATVELHSSGRRRIAIVTVVITALASNSIRNHCSHYQHSCHASCSHQDTCQCHTNRDSKSTQSNRNRSGLNRLTPALTTDRLKPTRQRTKNAVCSILEQGEVCLEFIRLRNGVERIVDVCRISSDGMRVLSIIS